MAISSIVTDSDLIPFTVPPIGREEINAVADSLRSRSLTTGLKTSQFEEEFCPAVGARHAVAVNSSVAGMELALAALDIGVGDDVVTSALTFGHAISAITRSGARPILVDVGSDGNLDPVHVGKRITKATKAIIPVHLAGASCDMDSIWTIANDRRLRVIEDATHTLGGSHKSRQIGSSYGRSDAVVFSMGISNNITTGESGMVVTGSDELHLRMKALMTSGLTEDISGTVRGAWPRGPEPLFSYSLSEIQSSIGIHQVRKMALFHAERQSLAIQYDHGLANLSNVELPLPALHGMHGWHLYMIRLRLELLRIGRAEFMQQMREKNIECMAEYAPIDPHRFTQILLKDHPCPRSTDICSRLVPLPIYPGLRPSRVKRVIEAVRDILTANRITARMYMTANSNN